MRIALIAPPWMPVPPPAYGGIELMVDRLAHGMHQAGHDVLLFTTGDSTCPVPRGHVLEQAEGERIGHVVPELRHVLHAYEAAKDYDIVHDHTMAGPLYAERFENLAVVTTNHGPFNDELRDLYQMLGHRVPVIAISHAQARAAGNVPIARVIHHGLDPSRFPFTTEGGDSLLFLGRMTPDKGAREAAQIARAAGVPLKLAAKMRERWEREYFDDQVRPLLTSEVEYVGEVGWDEKVELLAGARALLNPIQWPEPFGLAMIESLACGTPVLAFPKGAAPEIVEHGVTGLLARDASEMIEHVGRIDELDRQACRDAVEGHFSADRMITEHVELYERVLTERLPAGTR